jgi:glucose-6-phosphate 1-dehydrogenase
MSAPTEKGFSILTIGVSMIKPSQLVFTIFGSTGDLSYRKLLPALYHLEARDRLDKDFIIRCIGRRTLSREAYLDGVRPWIEKQSRFPLDETLYARFSARIEYVQMQFTDPDSYSVFADLPQGQDNVHYLAVAPQYFEVIAEGVHAHQQPTTKHRLILEKPFGDNLAHAQRVNAHLTKLFGADQLYYIDHYLGKEMIQNILAIRFANRIYSQLWHRDHIDHIQITVAESVGIENRAAYYEQAGAIKDMLQNHLLQILSYTTMQEPASLKRSDVTQAQVEVLKHLKLKAGVLGQYAAHQGLSAYTEEANVDPKSRTETFVALELSLEAGPLRAVPIFMRTGKRLDHRATYIKIIFKPSASKLYSSTQPEILTIKVQPDEGVSLEFSAKKPGTLDTITHIKMDFCQSCILENRINTPEAYERLLDDAFHHDNSLFTPWSLVELSWSFGEQLEKATQQGRLKLETYPSASAGPMGANTLIEAGGRSWLSEDELSYEKP